MEPRNLLVMMADEHNPKMLGCAGHPLAQTPNLDALAARCAILIELIRTARFAFPRAQLRRAVMSSDIGYWDNAIAYGGRGEGLGASSAGCGGTQVRGRSASSHYVWMKTRQASIDDTFPITLRTRSA